MAYFRPHAVVVAVYRIAVYLLLGDANRRAVTVSFLAADIVEDVEAALEVHGGFEHVLGVGYEGGVVALRLQGFGERYLIFWNPLPAGGKEGLSFLGDPVSKRPGAETRIDRPPGGNRRYGLRVCLGEPQTFFRERIQVRGLYPVVAISPDMILAKAV